MPEKPAGLRLFRGRLAGLDERLTSGRLAAMTADDDFRRAAFQAVAHDRDLAELLRRCLDESDEDACAELDERGVDPPVIALGPEPKRSTNAAKTHSPQRGR